MLCPVHASSQDALACGASGEVGICDEVPRGLPVDQVPIRKGLVEDGSVAHALCSQLRQRLERVEASCCSNSGEEQMALVPANETVRNLTQLDDPPIAHDSLARSQQAPRRRAAPPRCSQRCSAMPSPAWVSPSEYVQPKCIRMKSAGQGRLERPLAAAST